MGTSRRGQNSSPYGQIPPQFGQTGSPYGQHIPPQFGQNRLSSTRPVTAALLVLLRWRCSALMLPGAALPSARELTTGNRTVGGAAPARRCGKRGPGRTGPRAPLPGQPALPVQHAQLAVVAGDDRTHRPRRDHAARAVDLLPHQPVARPRAPTSPWPRRSTCSGSISTSRRRAFPIGCMSRSMFPTGARAGAASGAAAPADRRECDQIWRVEEPQDGGHTDRGQARRPTGA